MDTEWLARLNKLNNSNQLTAWEAKAFKDMYDRNSPVLSFKQEEKIRIAEDRVFGRNFGAGSKRDLECNCTPEYFKDVGYRIVDNAGNVYGPPLSSKDAQIVSFWFNEILGEGVGHALAQLIQEMEEQVEKELKEKGKHNKSPF